MNRAERRRQQRLLKKPSARANPEYIDDLRGQAATYLQAGDLKHAEQSLVDLLHLQPDDTESLNLMGMLAGQRGDYITACRMLKKAVRIDPGHSHYHNNLALALREAGRPEAAVAALRKAITLDPTLVQAHNNLGNTLERTGDIKGAITAYRQAVQLDPNYSDAHFNLGKLLLLDVGKFDEAAEEFIASLRCILSGNTSMQTHSEAPRLDHELARKALLDLKQALDKSSVEFFLRSGTLLGCIREGDLLEHDKDIDIGVFEQPDLGTLQDLLLKTGKFKSKADRYRGQNRVSLTIFHNNGTAFDIYQHQDKNNHYLVEHFLPGRSFARQFTRFKLTPTAFLGTTFCIPDNSELYLTELYGDDWHVPKPFFDSRVSSKNQAPSMEIISKCYAYCRIDEALNRADTERALALCDQILEKFSDDEIAGDVKNFLKGKRQPDLTGTSNR